MMMCSLSFWALLLVEGKFFSFLADSSTNLPDACVGARGDSLHVPTRHAVLYAYDVNSYQQSTSQTYTYLYSEFCSASS
jgi:hypothetical protein